MTLAKGKTKTTQKTSIKRGRPKKLPESKKEVYEQETKLIFPRELKNKVNNINILPIDKNSIVVVHVDTTNITQKDTEKLVNRFANYLSDVTKKTGVYFIVSPFRGTKQVEFEVIKKKGK